MVLARQLEARGEAIASLILLSVSLFTFLAWYFTRQAEERRKRPKDDLTSALVSAIEASLLNLATLG